MTTTIPLFQLSDEPQGDENEALIERLARTPRELPFHLFYDDAGSALFQQITQTDEYYLTRTERQILRDNRTAILDACGKQRTWVEPGAGDCEKIGLLMDASHMAGYVALDLVAAPLHQAAARLQAVHPDVALSLLVGDFRKVIPQVQRLLPSGPRTIFYPGSSIGNFAPPEAARWLGMLATLAGDDGKLLIGFDLPKAPALLNAAYNDAAGVTAAFHLNILQHLRRRGFQIEPADYLHSAHYNEAEQRIEMRLQVRRATSIGWRNTVVNLDEGETILTEYSYKYSVAAFQTLASNAGWRYHCHWQDARGWFAVALFERQ